MTVLDDPIAELEQAFEASGDDTRRRLVVIGNGMAGARTVEEILARGGARAVRDHHVRRRAVRQLQPHHAQPRAVRRGEPTPTSSSTRWPGTSRTASPCTPGSGSTGSTGSPSVVFSDDGQVTPYDELIIATGSRSFMPPMEGLRDRRRRAAARRVRLPHHRRHPRR